MPTEDIPLDVAQHFFTAIETGDVEAVSRLYAPDVVVWHNTDGVEQTAGQNLATLTWMVRHLSDRRYEVIRRVATEDGFVQQHVLRAQAPGGELALPACIVARVQEGRISRIDEYLDSAHLAVLTPGGPQTVG